MPVAPAAAASGDHERHQQDPPLPQRDVHVVEWVAVPAGDPQRQPATAASGRDRGETLGLPAGERRHETPAARRGLGPEGHLRTEWHAPPWTGSRPGRLPGAGRDGDPAGARACAPARRPPARSGSLRGRPTAAGRPAATVPTPGAWSAPGRAAPAPRACRSCHPPIGRLRWRGGRPSTLIVSGRQSGTRRITKNPDQKVAGLPSTTLSRAAPATRLEPDRMRHGPEPVPAPPVLTVVDPHVGPGAAVDARRGPCARAS